MKPYNPQSKIEPRFLFTIQQPDLSYQTNRSATAPMICLLGLNYYLHSLTS